MPGEDNLGGAALTLATDPSGLDSGLNAGLTRVQKWGNKAVSAAGAAGKRVGAKFTAEMGQQLRSVGTSLTIGLTAPLVAFGALALTTAADFQTGMNRVQAVSGATESQLVSMRQQAKELGATTQFSATQAADAMGFLAQAGFDANQIMGSMEGTLRLAASAQLDMGTAADIVSNVLTGYRKEVGELDGVVDVLAKTFTSTNTDLVQLGEAMKFAGPVASAAGVDFEVTAAAIGLMGNAGVQASLAGTSLRGAIARLLSPTKEASDQLNQLGIAVTDSHGKLLPLDTIIEQLGPHADNAGAFMEIFGLRAGPAMAALVAQGAGSLRGLTTELQNAGGTAQTIADAQMQGLGGALKELKSAFEALQLAISDSGVGQFVEDITRSLASFLREIAALPAPVLAAGTALAALAAAAGPVLVVAGGLITIWPGIAAAVAAIISPIGLVAAGVIAVGAAFVIWHDEIINFLVGLGQAILDVPILGDAISLLGELFQAAWDILKDVGSWLADTLGPIVEAVWETVANFFQDIHDRGQQVRSGADQIEHMDKVVDDLVESTFDADQNMERLVDEFVAAETVAKAATGELENVEGATKDVAKAAKDTEAKIVAFSGDLRTMATIHLPAAQVGMEKVETETGLLETAIRNIQPPTIAASTALGTNLATALRDAKIGTHGLIGPTQTLDTAFATLGVTSTHAADQQLQAMETALDDIRAAVNAGILPLEDLTAATQAYEQAVAGVGDAGAPGATAATNSWEQGLTQVSTAVTDLGADIAEAFTGSESVKEAFVNALGAMKTAVIRLVGEQVMGLLLNQLAKLVGFKDGIKGIGGSLSNLFGGGSGSGGGIGGFVSGLFGGGGEGSEGGGGGSGSSHLGFDIFGAVMDVRTEKALNFIELNTRKTSRQLELGLQPQADAYWPYMEHANTTLWTIHGLLNQGHLGRWDFFLNTVLPGAVENITGAIGDLGETIEKAVDFADQESKRTSFGGGPRHTSRSPGFTNLSRDMDFGSRKPRITINAELRVDDSRHLDIKKLKSDDEFGNAVLTTVNTALRTNKQGFRRAVRTVRDTGGA